MRLVDLIEKHDDDSILMRMAMLYDIAEDREEFRRVLGVLRTIQPVDSEDELYVKLISNECDGWYDVGSHDGTRHRNGVPVDYELDYLPWNQWLGMKIENSTLFAMQEIEIIAHCLWTMTSISFDPDDLQWDNEFNEHGGVWTIPLDDLDEDTLDDLLDEFSGLT